MTNGQGRRSYKPGCFEKALNFLAPKQNFLWFFPFSFPLGVLRTWGLFLRDELPRPSVPSLRALLSEARTPSLRCLLGLSPGSVRLLVTLFPEALRSG